MIEMPALVKPFLDAYEESVAEVDKLDAQLGDTGGTARSALNKLVRENTSAVADAQKLAQHFTLEEDSIRKVVMAQTVLREVAAMARKIVDEFIEANSPKSDEAATLTEAQKVELHEKRRNAQVNARMILNVILHQLSGQGIDDKNYTEAGIAECPAAIRGSFGPRGKTGRKLPKSLVTIDDEPIGAMNATEIAKAIKTTATKLRLAVEAKYENETPENWEITLNDKHIVGAPLAPSADGTFEDTDEADDDDFEDDEEV